MVRRLSAKPADRRGLNRALFVSVAFAGLALSFGIRAQGAELPKIEQSQYGLEQQPNVAPSLPAINSLADDPIAAGILLTPQAVRQAVDRVRPALVVIESFAGSSATAGRIGGIRQRGEGNSTGVVIGEDGTIITSTFNFIEQPAAITVITSDGQRHIARVLGRDDTRNLCVLKIDGASDLPTAQWAGPSEVRLGQWAISVGVGYGDTAPAASLGIISAKNRFAGRALQTDANTSPANYGGPLIDIEGRVLGICVPLSPETDELGAGVQWYDSGIGFAVTLSEDDQWLTRLKEGQWLRPARLGVRIASGDQAAGVVAVEIVPDGPAASAGFEPNDRIVQIDEHPIADEHTFRQVLRRYVSGDRADFLIERGDSRLTVEVVLGTMSQ